MSDPLANDAKGSGEGFWETDSWIFAAIVTLSGGVAMIVLLKLKKRRRILLQASLLVSTVLP